jgi:hypothetical protein
MLPVTFQRMKMDTACLLVLTQLTLAHSQGWAPRPKKVTQHHKNAIKKPKLHIEMVVYPLPYRETVASGK